MGPEHAWIGYYLKIWADFNSFPAETKGSCAHIRPKRILVTSNYTIEEIWKNQPIEIAAIGRRFKFIHLKKPPPIVFGEKKAEAPPSDSIDEAFSIFSKPVKAIDSPNFGAVSKGVN